MDILEPMKRGAVLAGRPFAFDDDNAKDRFGDETDTLRAEWTNKWRHPRALYLIIIACSMAAVVQGQDQSLINGANIFYPCAASRLHDALLTMHSDAFGIGSDSRQDTLIVRCFRRSRVQTCSGSRLGRSHQRRAVLRMLHYCMLAYGPTQPLLWPKRSAFGPLIAFSPRRDQPCARRPSSSPSYSPASLASGLLSRRAGRSFWRLDSYSHSV